MSDDEEQVPNRYRERLGWALPEARGHAERSGRAFARVVRAMNAGAWDSPLAEEFYAGCTAAQTSAGNAAQGCVDTMEHQHSREPVLVPRDDRRARFS